MSQENQTPITEQISNTASNAYEAVKETAANTYNSAANVLSETKKGNTQEDIKSNS